MNRPATLILLAASAAAQAQISIDGPKGGWRHSGGEPSQHMQDVHYPASRVNAGANRFGEDGRDLSASIRGRVAKAVGQKNAGAKAARQPYLLVVNGVPMPLAVGEDGGFARPYAFPPGANSVQVSSPDRKETRRVSFYDANGARQRVGLRVVLSWDSDHTDLDLHVVSPDGEHVFFGNRVGKNGGALDVDVTDGYGPEIYAIPSPPPGNWQVYVNYYGGGMGGGSEDGEEAGSNPAETKPAKAISIAQVALVMHEGTPDERREVFRIPLRRPGELTLIKSFVYP